VEKAGVISGYLDAIEQRLAFDRSLSRHVRQEIEDHLLEAVASDAGGDSAAAERRAVTRFGSPDMIAAQFVAVSVARQTRKTGVAVILVLAATFAAMKARIAWYVMIQWSLADDLKAIGALVGMIDVYAFWLAVISGTAGCLCAGFGGTPSAIVPSYLRQTRWFLVLSAAAAGALLVSVTADGILTALRLSAGWSVAAVVPLVSMACEIACAGILAFHVRAIARRAAAAAG